MNDVFIEEVVKQKNRGLSKALYGILSITMWFFVLVAAFNFWNILALGTDGSFGGVNWQAVIITVVAAGVAYLSFIMKNRQKSEFDYTLTNGLVEVARVINNNRRKKLVSFNMRNIEFMGSVFNEKYDMYSKKDGVKKLNCLLNPRTSNVYFVIVPVNSENRMILLEPSDEFVHAMSIYAQDKVDLTK